MKLSVGLSFLCIALGAQAFQTAPNNNDKSIRTQLQAQQVASDELKIQKEKLLQLIGGKSGSDAVLADPLTKEAIQITAPGVVFGGDTRRSVSYVIKSPSNKFAGSSDSFIDLLEPEKEESAPGSESSSSLLNDLIRRTAPYVPVPFRQPLAALTDGEYIPMVCPFLFKSAVPFSSNFYIYYTHAEGFVYKPSGFICL